MCETSCGKHIRIAAADDLPGHAASLALQHERAYSVVIVQLSSRSSHTK